MITMATTVSFRREDTVINTHIAAVVSTEDVINDSTSTAEFPSRVQHVAVVLIIIPSVKVTKYALTQRVVYNNY